MKNLKFIIVFFIINTIHSQEVFRTVYLGFDVKNNTIGSSATNNKSSLDVIFGLGLIKDNLEFNLGGEVFSQIDFAKFTFSVGRQIKISENFKLIPALEYTNIMRSDNWGSGISQENNMNFHSLAVNLSARYNLTENISFDYMLNVLPRTDLQYQYGDLKIVPSNYIKIVYLIKSK